MKITGIVAEYNPFHNGHKYQIEKARQSADAVIAVMSGSFVQRGETAITDKWTRAKIALENGVDLVLELPVIYALNTAQKFAEGAVNIMDRMGVVNNLCFGSECGDIEKLIHAARMILNEPKEVSDKIKQLMGNGITYPSAREIAFAAYIDKEILSCPNNILAIEYIRALLKKASNINPLTVKRFGTGYYDSGAYQNIASASAIRNMKKQGKNIKKYVPYDNFAIYDESRLDIAVTAFLRIIDAEYISEINDVNEGLENRIKAAAGESLTIEELCQKIKTKRYPMSRIKRIIFSTLLGLTKEITEKKTDYIRVLGMNNIGKKILKEVKEKSDLKIVTKTADYVKDDIVFKKDILATDIFSLCIGGNSGEDYRKSPVVLNT